MLLARAANVTDFGFINGCILYGARKGHYAFNADNPDMVKAMKNEIQSVISYGRLADQRRAAASIFTEANSRVGMLIMCEANPGSMVYEIYALSVTNKYQHKGYGGRILDHALRQYMYHDVYARCLPVSETMKLLLTGRGFVFHDQDGDFETFLKPGADNREAALSAVPGY